MLELILPALAGGGLLWGRYGFKRRRRLQVWRKAAASCGLEMEESSSIWGSKRLVLRGRAGPLAVRMERILDREDGVRLIVVVPGPPEFSSVKICAELYRLWRRELKVGDESFDNAFYVTGPALLVRALLDAKMRHLLANVNPKGEISIVDGELRADVTEAQIRGFVPFFLDLSRRLAQPLDVVERLAHNARRDPEAGVRLQNLLQMIRELREDPQTAAALRIALTDSSPPVRLCAAKELGDEARHVLLALAARKKDDAVSAEAISALGRNLPFERARAILAPALEKRLTKTAGACLERLSQSQAAADFHAVAKVMESEEGELAALAAQALAATGNSAAEPLLIQALQREQKDLRAAAATALGRVGSVAAVLPLKEAAERSSSLHLDLRKATRQSIAEIQARLAGASPGQLSLAGAEAGQLSLAVDPAGQLSISGGKTGEQPAAGAAAGRAGRVLTSW
jgi:hypothetical protein